MRSRSRSHVHSGRPRLLALQQRLEANNVTQTRPVLRRRNVIECRQCGKTVPRTGVAQLFCSPRCKNHAARDKRATAKILGWRSPTSRAATPAQKNNSENNGLQRAKTAASVAVFLLGGGYRWPGAKLDRETAKKIIRTELGPLLAPEGSTCQDLCNVSA
jgi:hypothetical protein